MSLFLQELVNGLVQGSVYVLVAIGLSLVFGVLNVVNFAHGEFYVVGGFVAYFVAQTLGWPYPVGVVLSAVVGFVVGAAADRVAIRPLRSASEDSIFLSTFGLSLVLLYGVKLMLGGRPRAVPSDLNGTFSINGVAFTHQQLFVVLLTVALVGVLYLVLQRSYAGVVLRAVANDRSTAALMGIKVERVYLVAFAAAAALASVAGAAVAPEFSINPFSGQDILITAFIVVIVAGLGSLPGAVVIGLSLGVLEAMAAGYLPQDSREWVSYVMVVLVLLLRPQGLFPGRARKAVAL